MRYRPAAARARNYSGAARNGASHRQATRAAKARGLKMPEGRHGVHTAAPCAAAGATSHGHAQPARTSGLVSAPVRRPRPPRNVRASAQPRRRAPRLRPGPGNPRCAPDPISLPRNGGKGRPARRRRAAHEAWRPPLGTARAIGRPNMAGRAPARRAPRPMARRANESPAQPRACSGAELMHGRVSAGVHRPRNPTQRRAGQAVRRRQRGACASDSWLAAIAARRGLRSQNPPEASSRAAHGGRASDQRDDLGEVHPEPLREGPPLLFTPPLEAHGDCHWQAPRLLPLASAQRRASSRPSTTRPFASSLQSCSHAA